jgi:hypothetical protein
MKTLSFNPSAFCGAALLALIGSFTAVHATVLVSTDFDEGYTANTALFGQSGSSDIGLSGTFTQGASSATATVRNSTDTGRDLTYNVSGGGVISGGSHSVDISQTAGGVQDIFHRSLSSDVNSQSLFMRVVIRPETALNGNTFFRFYVTPDVPLSSVIGGAGGAAFGLRDAYSTSPGANAMMNNGTTTFSANTAADILTGGAANLLVAEFNWNGSAYDSVSIWVNPTASDSESPLATIAVTPFVPTSLSVMGLGIGNFNDGQTIAIDSFAIGTTWNDMVAIPEPSAGYMLLAFLLCATVFLRKRRSH